ncbi:MAG: MFS transporter [Terriglobia bacterium]
MLINTPAQKAPIPARAPLDYGVITALFLLLFVGLADNQMIAALLPVLVRAFHVSVAMAGMLVVVYAITAAAAGFTTGTLSDHYGRRVFLLGGAAAFVLASWLASRSETFSGLMLARALTGAAAGTISTCSLAYAGDFFEYRVRGKAIGLISIAYFAAPIIGIPVGAQIAARFGWRSTFLFFAALAVVASFASLILKETPGIRSVTAHKMRKSAEALQGFFRRRDLAAGIVIAFLVSGGLVGFLTYIGQWLSGRFGLTEKGIGWVFMLGGLAAVAGAPLGGALSDRLGKRAVAIIGNALLAVAVAVMPFFPWGALLLAIFALTSLGAAFRQGPLTALMTELIPGSERGSFMAARAVFSQLGIAAAALAGGVLYQHYGYAAVTGLCALMTAGVVILLAAFITEPEGAR